VLGALPAGVIAEHLEAGEPLAVSVQDAVAGVVEFQRCHTDHAHDLRPSVPPPPNQ
jgi:hypothetical protein